MRYQIIHNQCCIFESKAVFESKPMALAAGRQWIDCAPVTVNGEIVTDVAVEVVEWRA